VEANIKDHNNYPDTFEDVGLLFYISNEANRNDRSNVIESNFSTVAP